MNLEKFSERVDKLVRDIAEAKTEMKTVQKLFEHDHEKIIDETVGLGTSHSSISHCYAGIFLYKCAYMRQYCEDLLHQCDYKSMCHYNSMILS